MKKTYSELVQQLEELKQEAEAARALEVAGIITRLKEVIRFYNLTPEDLGFTSQRTRDRGAALSSDIPKYSDGVGSVWFGRGPRPRWLREALRKGATLDQFLTSQR